ncbi:MAG: Fe-S protein assembly co-chaperone HscB [Polyangiaceae bacterium]|nr:Fe-S protein assembly co-chaperone HscB [Polyangiaceae bacterium]MCW5788901.1 Fe-S protein assembly co-chaperone HscB [Polyangiaceae bacterium]
MDPFELLQIPPSFDLDLNALSARHRELSRALHPDRYVGAPSAERRQALGRAISVNEAWRRLKEPVSRAEALCERYGVPYGERAEPKASPDWLMEVMELREALAEARRARDIARVEQLTRDVKAAREATLERLTAHFRALSGGHVAEDSAAKDSAADGAVERGRGEEDSAADGGASALRGAVSHEALLRELGKLRYYRRFMDEAGATLDELA